MEDNKTDKSKFKTRCKKRIGVVGVVFAIVFVITLFVWLTMSYIKLGDNSAITVNQILNIARSKIRIIPSRWWPYPKYITYYEADGFYISNAVVQGIGGYEDNSVDFVLTVKTYSGEEVDVVINNSTSYGMHIREFEETQAAQFKQERAYGFEKSRVGGKPTVAFYRFNPDDVFVKDVVTIYWKDSDLGSGEIPLSKYIRIARNERIF